MPTHDESYDRGHIDGVIAARLAGHDAHFAAINGSLAVMAEEMRKLTLAVQRLGDQAVARDATVVTTAAALKDAEDARRSTSDRSWTPVTRVIAVLGGIAALIAVLGGASAFLASWPGLH
jgi:type VI protein secretion system component VasF